MKKNNLYFIHGANCGSWVWEGFSEFFKIRGFNSLTPDLRLHGVNPHDKPAQGIAALSLRDYVSDICNELSALDDKAVLIGHSMGGLLAQLAAQSVPVRALVLIEPAPPAGLYPKKAAVIQGIFALLRYGLFWKVPVRPSFAQAVVTSLHNLPPQRQHEVHSRFVYESGRALSEIGFSVLDRKKAAYVDEKRITSPVLVIAGGMDRIISPKLALAISSKYKNCTYKEFPEHAHWIIQEQGWENVAEYIFQWLDTRLHSFD
ncbi:MAG: alpha/beta hydrolase [Nitrospirae bacterium YQR-1]